MIHSLGVHHQSEVRYRHIGCSFSTEYRTQWNLLCTPRSLQLCFEPHRLIYVKVLDLGCGPQQTLFFARIACASGTRNSDRLI